MVATRLMGCQGRFQRLSAGAGPNDGPRAPPFQIWKGGARGPSLVRHQPRAVETGLAAHESRRHHRHRTNTTLLLVAEASSGTISVLEDRATITR